MNSRKEVISGFEIEASWRFGLDESRKEEGLAEIAQAVKKKKIRYYPSFGVCILEQMRYQTWQNRLIQGGILLLALALCLVLKKSKLEDVESIVLGSAFMAFAANICLSGVGSLFSRNMAELEQTLYFNLKQMVCIQILQAGILDGFILALFVIFCGDRAMGGTGAYLLYIIVPFLWSDIIYLHLLASMRAGGRTKGLESGMRGFTTGVICGMAAIFPAFLENAYAVIYLPAWGIAALAGIVVLCLEVRRLFGKIEGGEGLCLN